MSRWLVLVGVSLFVASCSDDSGKNGTPDAAQCTPTTCQAAGKNCGAMPDGCGGVIQCGSCTAPETCGGSAANVCGAGTCTPTTCAAQGKNCGTISDNCSDVLACGSCTTPETCGGRGVANVCGAKPNTDSGPKPDASGDVCDPTCMAQAGAVCCKQCGCEGEVKCMPVCDSPAVWDCEMMQCH